MKEDSIKVLKDFEELDCIVENICNVDCNIKSVNWR